MLCCAVCVCVCVCVCVGRAGGYEAKMSLTVISCVTVYGREILYNITHYGASIIKSLG